MVQHYPAELTGCRINSYEKQIVYDESYERDS